MKKQSDAPMRVLSLVAENIKKLRAVEITPRGDVVTIAGANGQGKTSVLDSIWWALAGAKHIQAVPIRQGETKARIRLDLGELIVERRFTPTASTVTVTSADGAKYDSPQRMLDALLGALAFDPLAFVGQDPRQQFEALRAIVPLEVDLEQLDQWNKSDYEARTAANRFAKERRAQAAGIAVPPNLPAARVDTAKLKDALSEAARKNQLIDREAAKREHMRLDLDLDLAELDRLRERIEARRVALASLEDLPELVSLDSIRQELDRAEGANAGLDLRERRLALESEASVFEAQSEELSSSIAERTAQKAAAMAGAQMPVPGLGFGDGVVTYGGIPFEQASTAEQLRVSVAIAMAAHPRLRVIRIKEGSLLDASNLELVSEMARENGYQVWIERVQTDGKVGFVIEDGSVVAVDGEPVGASMTAAVLSPGDRAIEQQAARYAVEVATARGYSAPMCKRLCGAWVRGFRAEGSDQAYSNVQRPLRDAWRAGRAAALEAAP